MASVQLPPPDDAFAPRPDRRPDAAPVLTRRAVLRGAIGVAGVAGIASLGVAACGESAYSATPTPSIITRWVRVPTTDLVAGIPVWVDLAGSIRQVTPGSETPPPSFEPDRYAAWLVKQPDGTVVAFDPRCTHQACLVDVSATEPEFLCRCHPGRFAFDGAVLGGPPPRPLNRYPTRVAGPDTIEIGLA